MTRDDATKWKYLTLWIVIDTHYNSTSGSFVFFFYGWFHFKWFRTNRIILGSIHFSWLSRQNVIGLEMTTPLQFTLSLWIQLNIRINRLYPVIRTISKKTTSVKTNKEKIVLTRLIEVLTCHFQRVSKYKHQRKTLESSLKINILSILFLLFFVSWLLP